MKNSADNLLQIKAITFDVGNVLVHWDPRRAYTPLFKKTHQDIDYFLNEVCTLEWHTKHDRGIPFQENISALQKKFPEYHDMIAIFESQWDNMFGDIIQGTVELLYQLKKRQFPLFCLTNFAADKFSDFKQQNEFTALFDDIIVSGEEKITKPDPLIYQILLERSQIEAEHMLFIDDRMENLMAAQKFGIQTHLFTDAENLKTDLIKRAIL